MKPSIFISGLVPPKTYEMLAKQYDVTMYDKESLITKKGMLEGLAGKEALLCLLSNSVDKEIIERNPQLKIIANYGAGFNNIDMQTATALAIPVTNTPAVSTNATADLAMGLILAIARRIVEGDNTSRHGQFTGWAPLYHLGVDVTNKALGIIGMGHIGRAVAKRAKAFDMKIIYYSRTRLQPEIETELNATFMEFEDVIKSSDFLSLHASYSPALHHMLGSKELSSMKPSAFLINTARGAMIDEVALLKALKENRLAGAALDVYEFEPQITKGLEALKNVILCPHLGNATIETREAMGEIAANNIISVLSGKQAIHCVNREIYK
ncbi:MAG: D-isomer specific 2-hydroxyacid dehydrogenase NAD-binding [Firmicutes bacterium]|nr:D-isomer specific 2-hydroxyacid dehydrogenase NAD-binding [Bacillota bacterium]